MAKWIEGSAASAKVVVRKTWPDVGAACAQQRVLYRMREAES